MNSRRRPAEPLIQLITPQATPEHDDDEQNGPEPLPTTTAPESALMTLPAALANTSLRGTGPIYLSARKYAGGTKWRRRELSDDLSEVADERPGRAPRARQRDCSPSACGAGSDAPRRRDRARRRLGSGGGRTVYLHGDPRAESQEDPGHGAEPSQPELKICAVIREPGLPGEPGDGS